MTGYANLRSVSKALGESQRIEPVKYSRLDLRNKTTAQVVSYRHTASGFLVDKVAYVADRYRQRPT